MKFNVKGLVFVGFAAAILSANAMAATGDEKVVTSKAYTDATYQTKIAAGTNGNVVTYTGSAGTVGSKSIDTTVTANSSNLVTSGAVSTAIANAGVSGKQTKSSADFQVGGTDGAWNTIGTDSYINVAAGTGDNINKAMFTINATTDTTLPSADSAKLATAGAAKGYADSKIAASIADGDTTHAPSGDAVNDALALKANTADLARVATTGAYSDLSGTPTIGDATLTVKQNGVSNATTFGANATSNVEITLATPDWAATNQQAGFIANKPTTMTGATDLAAGTSGFVPAPAAGDDVKFLTGAGTWDTPTNTTYGADGTTITLNGTTFSATTGSIAENGTGLVTSGTIYTALADKQDKQLGAAKVGSADSLDKGKLVVIDDAGKISKDTAKITTSVTSGSGDVVTSGAVYTAINGQLVPMPTSCTAAAPCALVATGATMADVAWVVMAQQ